MSSTNNTLATYLDQARGLKSRHNSFGVTRSLSGVASLAALTLVPADVFAQTVTSDDNCDNNSVVPMHLTLGTNGSTATGPFAFTFSFSTIFSVYPVYFSWNASGALFTNNSARFYLGTLQRVPAANPYGYSYNLIGSFTQPLYQAPFVVPTTGTDPYLIATPILNDPSLNIAGFAYFVVDPTNFELISYGALPGVTSVFDINVDPNCTGTFDPTFTDLYNICCISASTVPVEWSHFTAEAKRDAINLRWGTEIEQNNAGFEVERSEDGDRFTPIAFVEGKGNSNEPQTYSYQDQTVRAGKTYYYRLKQVDYDGKEDYSETLTVAIKVEKKSAMIHPNPTDGQAILRYTATHASQVSLAVYDQVGNLLLEEIYDAIPGDNGFTLNVDHLDSGVYFAKVGQGQDHSYLRFVVTE